MIGARAPIAYSGLLLNTCRAGAIDGRRLALLRNRVLFSRTHCSYCGDCIYHNPHHIASISYIGSPHKKGSKVKVFENDFSSWFDSRVYLHIVSEYGSLCWYQPLTPSHISGSIYLLPSKYVSFWYYLNERQSVFLQATRGCHGAFNHVCHVWTTLLSYITSFTVHKRPSVLLY